MSNLKQSSLFGNSESKNPPLKTDNILLIVGHNIVGLDPEMISRIFPNHIIESSVESLSTTSSFNISELTKIVNSLISDKNTRSVTILNTGAANNHEISIALKSLIIHNPKELGVQVNLIDVNELIYKTKELVTSARTASGKFVRTEFEVKQLKEVGIKNAVIYAARYGGIICVSDSILEKSIQTAVDLLNSKTEVTPVLYTSVYEVLEVFTDGQLRGLPEVHSPQFK